MGFILKSSALNVFNELQSILPARNRKEFKLFLIQSSSSYYKKRKVDNIPDHEIGLELDNLFNKLHKDITSNTVINELRKSKNSINDSWLRGTEDNSMYTISINNIHYSELIPHLNFNIKHSVSITYSSVNNKFSVINSGDVSNSKVRDKKVITSLFKINKTISNIVSEDDEKTLITSFHKFINSRLELRKYASIEDRYSKDHFYDVFCGYHSRFLRKVVKSKVTLNLLDSHILDAFMNSNEKDFYHMINNFPDKSKYIVDMLISNIYTIRNLFDRMYRIIYNKSYKSSSHLSLDVSPAKNIKGSNIFEDKNSQIDGTGLRSPQDELPRGYTSHNLDRIRRITRDNQDRSIQEVLNGSYQGYRPTILNSYVGNWTSTNTEGYIGGIDPLTSTTIDSNTNN